jgi:hypothetical protein
MWSFWPSHQRPLLLSKISRNKTSEKERCTPLGESWIVYIFIAWGNKLSNFCINRKTLGRYSHKLSIISKQSRLMHTELRYQVKTYTISNMPREKKNPPNSPQFFFFKCNMEMTSYARQDQTCECSMMPIQKNSRSTCFFCLLQQVPAKFSQEK